MLKWHKSVCVCDSEDFPRKTRMLDTHYDTEAQNSWGEREREKTKVIFIQQGQMLCRTHTHLHYPTHLTQCCTVVQWFNRLVDWCVCVNVWFVIPELSGLFPYKPKIWCPWTFDKNFLFRFVKHTPSLFVCCLLLTFVCVCVCALCSGDCRATLHVTASIKDCTALSLILSLFHSLTVLSKPL